MKLFVFAIVVILFSASAFPDDQPGQRIVMEENHECNAMGAIESAVNSCDRHDLEGFLDCFTKSNRPRAAKNIKKLFLEKNFNIKILSSEIASADDRFAKAAIKYRISVDGYSPVTVDSNLVLKLEDGSWRIQAEKVSSARTSDYAAQRELAFNFGGVGVVMMPEVDDNEGPADIGRNRTGRCKSGMCRPIPEIRQAPAQLHAQVPDFFDPNLPAGIGQHPGMVCKDGVCTIKK